MKLDCLIVHSTILKLCLRPVSFMDDADVLGSATCACPAPLIRSPTLGFPAKPTAKNPTTSTERLATRLQPGRLQPTFPNPKPKSQTLNALPGSKISLFRHDASTLERSLGLFEGVDANHFPVMAMHPPSPTMITMAPCVYRALYRYYHL